MSKPRKKKTTTIKVALPKPKAEPEKEKNIVAIVPSEPNKSGMFVYPVPPEFPSELSYYDAAKIEKFRREYKIFKQKYEEACR